MKICVFCASSGKIAPAFFEAAKIVAREAALAGHRLVCGGGATGLMGALADTTASCGGTITGVMPRFMHQMEWQHKGLNVLILVDTMHERKAMMLTGVDAVVALPGGCGTLEELLEVITLKQLGQFTKPVIIVNVNGFYEPLLDLFDRMIYGRFMRPELQRAWTVVKRAEAILPAIKSAPPWSSELIHFAKV
jgi:uncharacterized protein (TIGR00730 family)